MTWLEKQLHRGPLRHDPGIGLHGRKIADDPGPLRNGVCTVVCSRGLFQCSLERLVARCVC